MSQDYLLEARQMQAMSFAVHIPLVCFGIALPSLVVFTEWLHLHTGDPLYRTLARSWSKVMISLFAVGVVTGTVLSFELGLLWPAFMATFGDVFGVAFAAEGFSFFVEAIFIAIYVYGWDRLSPRMHLLSGIPVVIAGFAGSLFVISVNGWMNHPGGFALRDGSVVDVDPFSALFANSFFWHELIHMYLGGFIVTGFAIAAAYAWGWLRGRRGRYHRTALVIPLTLAALAAPVQVVVGDWAARTVASSSRSSSPRSRGSPRPPGARASEHLVGWYDGSGVRYGIEIPKLLSLLAFHEPNATVTGLDAVPEGCANAFMQLAGTRVAHRQAGRADALWLADPRRQGQAGGLIWRLEPQRPVRAVFVVVPDVDPQDPLEMAAADDQQPVQALGTDRANPSLGVRVRFGRPHRRQQHLGTLGAEHVVKAAGELRVMVADKEAQLPSLLAQCQQEVAACWVTQPPSGLAVTPPRWTRLLSSSMKNSTYSRCSQMLSAVKKSQATMPAACWRRNAVHVLLCRRGAGSSPWRRSVVRIAVAETRTPSRSNSPLMRW